ncbi:MAG: transposase [Muribaculaceae bacterium]|nr:transposase [Muribaculaceae bacterium]
MYKAILEGNYLMVDETCELVGVIDESTNISEYKKRYLWAFHDKASKLVSYLYEKGSRARDALLDFIKGFKGTLSTDGYAAYQIFDGEGYPDILHCRCWAHVRRKFKEAMDVATEACMDILQDINALFVNEQLIAAEKIFRREKKRKKLSRPIVNRIFDRASLLAKDTVLMGRDLFKKAVNLSDESGAESEKLPQGREGRTLEQPVRATDETHKTRPQELPEHRERGCRPRHGFHALAGPKLQAQR